MRSRAREGALGELIGRLVAPKSSPRLAPPSGDSGSARSDTVSVESRKVSFFSDEEKSGKRPRSSSHGVKKSDSIGVHKASSSPAMAALSSSQAAVVSTSLPTLLVTPSSMPPQWQVARETSESSVPKNPLLSLRASQPAESDAEIDLEDDDAFLDQIAPRRSLVDEAVVAPFAALLKSLHKSPAHSRFAVPVIPDPNSQSDTEKPETSDNGTEKPDVSDNETEKPEASDDGTEKPDAPDNETSRSRAKEVSSEEKETPDDSVIYISSLS